MWHVAAGVGVRVNRMNPLLHVRRVQAFSLEILHALFAAEHRKKRSAQALAVVYRSARAL